LTNRCRGLAVRRGFSDGSQPRLLLLTGPAAAAPGAKSQLGANKQNKQADEKMPFQQRVLNSILGVSQVPYR
jgi:hypothetical protein